MQRAITPWTPAMAVYRPHETVNAGKSAGGARLASGFSVRRCLRNSTCQTRTRRDIATLFRQGSSDLLPLDGGDDPQQRQAQQAVPPAEQHMQASLQPTPEQQQQLLPPATPAPQQATTIHSPVEHHGHPHSSQPLRYAQMGHSRFSRGAPHVCYWHLDGKGIFYVKPDMDELLSSWQEWLRNKQQQLGLAWPGADQQATAGLNSASSSSLPNGNEPHQHQKLFKRLQSSSILSAVAAAAAAVVALAAAVASVIAGHLSSMLEQQQDWGLLVLRVLAVAVVAGVCSVVAVQLGRLLVAFMILCYSGLSML